MSARRVKVAFASILFVGLVSAQTYTLPTSNTTENLRGISTPTNSVAWASGTHGTYLLTTDGGKTWRAAQVPDGESLDFRDVAAFDDHKAYLLAAGPGDQSRIYRTTDGGKNWTLQFTNVDPKGFFDCMALWDFNNGIAIGDPVNGKFQLIETDDAGKSWKPIPSGSLPPAIDGEGAFAASGTCIAVNASGHAWFATGGKVARVFRSSDFGKTWNVSDTPIIHGSDSTGIFSIVFRDLLHGVVAGGDYKQPEKDGPNLAYTEDGGISWKLSPLSPQFYFSAVGYSSKQRAAQNLIILGSAHAAYADQPGNKSWRKVWDMNLNSVSVRPDGSAIAVGPKGTIVAISPAQ